MAVGFCFGGFMGIFPAIAVEKFGIRNNGVNYGVMFIGFAVGGYIGPKLATSFKVSDFGLYSQAYIIATVFAFVGMLIALGLQMKERKFAYKKGECDTELESKQTE